MHNNILSKSRKCRNCNQWTFEKDIVDNFKLDRKIEDVLSLLKDSDQADEKVKEAISVLESKE